MYNQIPSSPLNATVTVRNNAPYNETITVVFTLQNSTGTGFLPVNQTMPLHAGASINMTFKVQTQNLPRGRYNLIAHVLPVQGHTDLSNSTMTGLLQVHYPGDINGDCVINIIDLSNRRIPLRTNLLNQLPGYHALIILPSPRAQGEKSHPPEIPLKSP